MFIYTVLMYRIYIVLLQLYIPAGIVLCNAGLTPKQFDDCSDAATLHRGPGQEWLKLRGLIFTKIPSL